MIIAAAQTTSVPGDVARNVAHHLRAGTVAAEQGVQLLVFPELSLTGYELALARANALRPESPQLDPLRRLVADAGMTVVVGAPLWTGGDKLHIGALALRPDGSVLTYTKVYVHESEQDVFTPGAGGPLLPVENASIGLAICADAKHPEHAASASARGATVYAASVMITEDEYSAKAALLAQYALEHRMAVLMANYSGVSGGSVSAGRSALWSEDGQFVAACTGNQQELLIGRKHNRAWSGIILPVS